MSPEVLLDAWITAPCRHQNEAHGLLGEEVSAGLHLCLHLGCRSQQQQLIEVLLELCPLLVSGHCCWSALTWTVAERWRAEEQNLELDPENLICIIIIINFIFPLHRSSAAFDSSPESVLH